MNVFQPVRDVPNVEGAFVFDSAAGSLVANDLQPLFRQDMLAAAAKRMVTMFAIADLNFEVCDEWVLQFDRYHLAIRRAGRLSICVVSREQPRLGILRMAMNLVLHEIEAQVNPPNPMVSPLGYQPPPTPRLGPNGPNPYQSAPRPAAPPSANYGQPLAPPASRPPASRPPAGSRPTPQQSAAKPSAPGAAPKKKNNIWG